MLLPESESSAPSPSILSSPAAFATGVQTPTHTYAQFEELVHNVVSLRREMMNRTLDPRRNIDKECGFPDSLSAEQYWDLYQRDAIAARVVECVPKAVWRKQPTVFEDEDNDTQTPFEEAWDNLGRTIRGERSYYQDEGGNPVMNVMERVDILSGAGQYAVILLGLDDGRDLREPVAGVVEKFSQPEKVKKAGEKAKPKPVDGGDGDETEDEDAPAKPTANRRTGGVYSLTWNGPRPAPGSRYSIATNAYVQPLRPSEYSDVTDEYEEFPKDAQEAELPESSLGESGDGGEGSGDGGGTPCRTLLYLRAFPEISAQITHYETNPTSPRYGQPTHYLLTFNDAREQSWTGQRTMAPQHQRSVHWTRIVHVPSDGQLSSPVFGTERLRQVYRHILSLQKLYHGDGEMFWKGAFPGISFETHPQLGGQVDVNRTAMRTEVEQYQNGLQRILLSMGMTAKMLSPTVSDPTPHIEAQLTAIAIRVDIPKRILMGSERGELSSAQDSGEWSSRVAAWQTNDRNPRVVIPLVDRLINVGALPEPTGYSIDWPEAETSSDAERAQVALTLTQAMTAYLQGNGASFMTPMDYLTRVWQFTEEEACAIVEGAEAVADQLAAEQEEQMLRDMDMREEELDRGLVADPNDPDLIPDTVAGGGDPFGGEAEQNGFPPKGPPKPNGKPKPPAFAGNAKIVKTIPWMKRNEFCPTGKGGKIDPTCSPKERRTKSGERLVAATRGKDKKWRLADGSDAPEHVQKLGIPPAWTDVYVNPSPRAMLVAMGVDAKGRVQSKYSDSHWAKSAASKFARVTELRKKREGIYKELDRDSSDPALRDNADCLRVVMRTGMRPGSDEDTGADHKSYGATTLEGRHVIIGKGGSVTLRLVTGKNKGREVDFPIRDAKTAAMLKERAKSAGPNGRLFDTNAQSLRDYSKSKDGKGFKTKDHRTALGTETALTAMKDVPTPKNLKEYKNALKSVATEVAATLGNTPSVALKSYIDPIIFTEWKKGAGIP